MLDKISQISMMRIVHLGIGKNGTNMIWEWVRKVVLDNSISKDKDRNILNLKTPKQQTLNSQKKNSKNGFLTLPSTLSR